MSRFQKYGVLSTVRFTQLHETVCQLKTIKYPTGVIKELTNQLEWIEKDFPRTIELLNNEGKIYNNKIYENHNTKNLQLHIEFI